MENFWETWQKNKRGCDMRQMQREKRKTMMYLGKIWKMEIFGGDRYENVSR